TIGAGVVWAGAGWAGIVLCVAGVEVACVTGGVLVAWWLPGLTTTNHPTAMIATRPSSTARRICWALSVLFMWSPIGGCAGGSHPSIWGGREGAGGRGRCGATGTPPGGEWQQD